MVVASPYSRHRGGGGNQTSTNANVVQEHLVCCQAGDVRMERR